MSNKITYDAFSKDCHIICGFPKYDSTSEDSEGVEFCHNVIQFHSPDIELANNIMKSIDASKLSYNYSAVNLSNKQTFIDIRPEGNNLCYKHSQNGSKNILSGKGPILNRSEFSEYIFCGGFWQDGIYIPITNNDSSIATDYKIITYSGSIPCLPTFKVALWDTETSMTNQTSKSTNGNFYSTYNKKLFSYRAKAEFSSSLSFSTSSISKIKIFLSGGAGSLKMSDDYYFVGNTNVAINNNMLIDSSDITYCKNGDYLKVFWRRIRLTYYDWVKSNNPTAYTNMDKYSGWIRPVMYQMEDDYGFGVIEASDDFIGSGDVDSLISKQLIQVKYDTSSSIILYIENIDVEDTCISYLNFDSGVEDSESVARGLKYICSGSGTALTSDKEATIELYSGNGFFDEYETLHSYGAQEAKQRCTSAVNFQAYSRTNKLGRYDNFENATSNLTYCNNTNFNKYNNVFENVYGFIEYTVYNHDDVKSYNTVFVSESQNYNRFNDVLVCDSISMTSPMDGRYGNVVCIESNQQGVYVIQNNAVAILDYNSRSVSQELGSYRAKEYNRCDYTYLDGTINIINNEEVVATEHGILLLSDKASRLLLVNAAQQQPIVNISDAFGMNIFFDNLKKSYDNTTTVTAMKSNKYTLLYSKYHQEAYVTYGEEALAFSFKEQAFTSIYPYGRVKFIQENFYYRKGSVLFTTNLEYSRGSYNIPYSYVWGQTGAERPGFFFITYDIDDESINPDEDAIDAEECYIMLRVDGNDFGNTFKRFQNIRFNGVSILDGDYKPNEIMLDTLSYENNLCKGSASLIKEDDRPSNMKRKYDTWFCNLPRISYDGNGDSLVKSDFSRSSAAMTNDKPSGYFLLVKAAKDHYVRNIKLSKLSVSYDEII